MKLKAATLFALVGTGIKLVWTLAMMARSGYGAAAPILYRIGAIPSVLFEASLFVFFLVLFIKQDAGGASHDQ